MKKLDLEAVAHAFGWANWERLEKDAWSGAQGTMQLAQELVDLVFRHENHQPMTAGCTCDDLPKSDCQTWFGPCQVDGKNHRTECPVALKVLKESVRERA